jgi:hypothetical protein
MRMSLDAVRFFLYILWAPGFTLGTEPLSVNDALPIPAGSSEDGEIHRRQVFLAGQDAGPCRSVRVREDREAAPASPGGIGPDSH